MPFIVVDQVSIAAGAANEDRAGARSGLAWIFDGATDVVEQPLTGAASDAAWLSELLHGELQGLPERHLKDLGSLMAHLTGYAATQFERAAQRPPADRSEHPSAAAILAHLDRRTLEFAAVGDCALIAATPSGEIVASHGIGLADGADASLAAMIASFQKTSAQATAAAARAHIWPTVRKKRAAMNTEAGYGVLSITPPPERFVVKGSIDLDPDSMVLLATDGLARLVDVFGRYSPQAFFEAAISRGLAALAAELRNIETADPHGHAHPRVKTSDDATGLLLRVT